MKNKKLFTRALSLMICMIMVLGSVAAGADGIESIFSEKAQAASVLDGKLLWPVSSSYSMTRPFSATGHKAVDINNCTGKDIKKNRIDHMTYLPGMEDIGSEILDQVVEKMNAYDYDQYTAADVKMEIGRASCRERV